jgi:hypothetical protein
VDTPPAAPAEAADSPSPWLADLEARVREAVAEIGRLRQENRRLEKELAKARKAAAGNGGAAAWEQERAEVRTRLERLTAHLEGVLGQPAPEGEPATAAEGAAGPTG